MGNYYQAGICPIPSKTDMNCCPPRITDSCPAPTKTACSTVISSGQFTFSLPLMSIDAFGIASWSFSLEYLRYNAVAGLLGVNFNFPQNVHLEPDGTDVVLVTEDNTRERFTPTGDGNYSSEGNNTAAVLTRTTVVSDDEYFTLRSSAGVVTVFDGFDTSKTKVRAAGRPRSMTDRYGNSQQFTWGIAGGVAQVASVTDGYGRTITYRYYGPERNYQLREIEDFLGRKLSFQYDEANRLVAVVTPSILKATEGNTFPGGTAYVFQYDADNPRPERRDDLIRVWYPNEATPFIDAATRTVDVARVYADAEPRYVIEYGQDPTDEDHYGRVVRETVGDPNGGPGGTYSFIYTSDPLQMPANLIDPSDSITHRTVVTDRNGNQTIHDFNGADMVVRKEVLRSRSKIDVDSLPLLGSYVTWTKYNAHNQPEVVVYPEGNSVEYEYDDGMITSWQYARRIGLLKTETQRPGNPVGIEVTGTLTPDVGGVYEPFGAHNGKPCYRKEISATNWYIAWDGTDTWYLSTTKGGSDSDYWTRNSEEMSGEYAPHGGAGTANVGSPIPSRSGSSGQTELTRRYFYDPLFNRQCAVIERRGNPIGSTVTVSGNGGGIGNPNGTYLENGYCTGKPAYQRDDEGFWLWWNGFVWVISVNIDPGTDDRWTNDLLEGDYVATPPPGQATGTAHVDATYFAPQNGGDAADMEDRSRFTTLSYFDYQKNKLDTISQDQYLQEQLGLSESQIEDLISHVNTEMQKTDGTGGIPAGFPVNLGDINGDGTGDGTDDGSSGVLPPSAMLGNVVKIKHPPVRQLVENESGDPWKWVEQNREELFTSNARGQATTHTDPEGNLTVYVRYPFNDPEGDGQFVSEETRNQYGRMEEIHADASPNDVMSLVGQDGDLVDFKRGKYVSAVLADNPTGYWRLNESSGTAADTSGNGQGATYTGQFTLEQVGPLSEPCAAVLLEPGTTHGYVDAGDPDLQIAGSITMEAWVKVTSFPTSGNYATIISKGYKENGGSNTGYWLAVWNDSGTLKLVAGAGSGLHPVIASWQIDTDAWKMGQWVHVVGRYDGTNWAVYLNGSQKATASGAAPLNTSPRKLLLGALDNNDTNVIDFLDGTIGEVAIYDYALPAKRILAHYDAGVAPWYLDLVTRYQGIPGGIGCSSCGYDPLGNVLSQTDPRGFTTTYDRNELGEAYRVTSPAPYNYRQETHYDANRNVLRTDIEDKVPAFASEDPTSAEYAKFIPTGSGSTAHVPTKAGAGGAIRPGWFTNLYAYDLLDNKVKDDIDATGSTPQRLVATYAYDPNQNLVKITKPVGNIVEYDYDERDLRIATRVGYVAGLEPGAVSISVYDGNGNLIDQIGPEDRLGGSGATTLTALLDDAFRSGEPMTHIGTWVIENTLDGFDRAIKATDAIGNVTEFSHDPDGRVVQTARQGPVGGASPTDREGTNNVELAISKTRFDEAGRAYEVQQQAFVSDGNDLQSGRTVTQNLEGLQANSPQNRTGQSYLMVDDGTAQGPSEDSYVLTRNVFDRAGRLVAVATDNGAVTAYDYDGAGRQVRLTYPNVTRESELHEVGSVEMAYDAAGNLTRTKRIDKPVIDDPPGGLVAEEVFESFACYDALNRLVVSASQGADGSLEEDLAAICAWPPTTQTIVTRIGYDSRGNQTLVIDAKGNTSITVYDGASRAVESIRHLRRDGDGGPPQPDATFLADGGAAVRTVSVYDADGRLSELIDDRGGTTLYTYDALDRQVSMTFHDGSTRTTLYNAASDVVEYTDENGSAFAYTYDAIGGLTAVGITPASHVAGHDGDSTRGTTSQALEYDGLSRKTKAVDTTTVDDAEEKSAACDLYFDSLARVVEERQTHDLDGTAKDRYVTYDAFTSLPATGFAYPGVRGVAYNYDELYRRTEIIDGSDVIAMWSFFGPARVAEVRLLNNITCTHMNNDRTHSAVQTTAPNPPWETGEADRLGYDGAGRMITKRHLESALNVDKGYDNTYPYAGFSTAYDLASNKLYERHLHAESRSHLYPSQDSLNRLREYQRGTLEQDSETGAVTVATPITLPGTDQDRTYNLDGLGNWRRTTYAPVGGSQATEVRQHNSVNQLTRFGTTPVLYDHGDNAADADPDIARRGNGNVADDGTRTYAYDALNRLVSAARKSDQAQIARYVYDALGRRVRKEVLDGGLPGTLSDGVTDFLYSGMQCIEERDDSDEPLRQYVWAQYIDELIQQRDLGTPDKYYYALSDLLYRTTALTDGDRYYVEVYDTDAYGRTLIYDQGQYPNEWFTDYDHLAAPQDPTCRYLFTGREYDAELSDASTQIYFYRARYYSPALGRFLSRDPLGYARGMNLYVYLRGHPVISTDPWGLDDKWSNEWQLREDARKRRERAEQLRESAANRNELEQFYLSRDAQDSERQADNLERAADRIRDAVCKEEVDPGKYARRQRLEAVLRDWKEAVSRVITSAANLAEDTAVTVQETIHTASAMVEGTCQGGKAAFCAAVIQLSYYPAQRAQDWVPWPGQPPVLAPLGFIAAIAKVFKPQAEIGLPNAQYRLKELDDYIMQSAERIKMRLTEMSRKRESGANE